MNKAQLIKRIADKVGISKKQAEEAIDELVNTVIEKLKADEEVTIVGFGTFSPRKRHARMGVNPLNPKERINQPETVVPKFKAGKTLKDALKAKV